MKTVGMCSTVAVVESVFSCFPFVDDFSKFMLQERAFDRLRVVYTALEAVVDVLSEKVTTGALEFEDVQLLMVCLAAQSRCELVFEREHEIMLCRGEAAKAVCCSVISKWLKRAEDDGYFFVKFDYDVYLPLAISITRHVEIALASDPLTVEMVSRKYGAIACAMVCTVLPTVVIVGKGDIPFDTVMDDSKDKVVVPVGVYRAALFEVSRRDLLAVPQLALAGLVDVCEADCVRVGTVPASAMVKWIWLVLSAVKEADGYCYQLLFPPEARVAVCITLGYRPLVSQLRVVQSGTDYGAWSLRVAVVERVGDGLHVSVPGIVAGILDEYDGAVRIGGADSPDYYAKALVDGFIAKHRVRKPPVQQPLDAAVASLTLGTATSGQRVLTEVACALYAGVGESVSPGSGGGLWHSGASATGDAAYRGTRDVARVAELQARLDDGAVIHEEYYRRSLVRFGKKRPRPALVESRGRCFHVFSQYQSIGGGGTGPWHEDTGWDVPGWKSYVAVFRPSPSYTLSFVSPVESTDLRMDCTGAGKVDLGGLQFAVGDVVLWFSQSIRFELQAATEVVLRISVPDAGFAAAFSAAMRRYVQVPGYAVVVRSFDLVSTVPGTEVPLQRDKRQSVAGCFVYSGEAAVSGGRCRLIMTGTRGSVPMRLLMKVTPVSALEYFSVCGLRLFPVAHDYVAVLVEPTNTEIFVTARAAATVSVSVLQIVDVCLFDTAVAATSRAVAVK